MTEVFHLGTIYSKASIASALFPAMSRDHDYCVYIVTNYSGTVLYIGITSDLEGRLWEHANGESGSKFTRKYHVNTLLYYEEFGDVNAAIAREKQLKGWTRAKKEALIRTMNPLYDDLGVALGLRGVCRQPEGPSTALHSAQDDRVGRAKVSENSTEEGLSTALVPRCAQDDRERAGRS